MEAQENEFPSGFCLKTLFENKHEKETRQLVHNWSSPSISDCIFLRRNYFSKNKAQLSVYQTLDHRLIQVTQMENPASLGRPKDGRHRRRSIDV